MRALVTGGAGFIGSHLVEFLAGRGDAVLVVGDLSRGRFANLDSAQGIELVQQDVCSALAMRETMLRFCPDVVFHLAAQVDVRSSMTDPAADAQQNVVGAISVMAAAVAAGASRVVLSSTGGAIYGDAAVLPTPESEAPNPISAYGLAKWASERYGQWFSCTSGINVIALRYSNVYGPRQGASGESGVVAQFCAAAIEGRAATIFGDGLASRDFVYVDDVVAANIAAAGLRATPYGEYNVGSGREVTILQLARMVREASGVKPGSRAVCFEKARAGEVRHSCLDVSRIRRDLDLPPPVPLASGIERTLEWACAASLDSCGKSA